MPRTPFTLALGLLAVAVPSGGQASAPLVFERSIPLSGVEGRIDHMAADPRGQRLFVAALGNNSVEVVDLRAGRVVRHLDGFREPQGIAFAPETNRLFVANGEGARCDMLDAASLQRMRSVRGMDDADNVRYDAAARRIYIGYGAGALSMLDAAAGSVVGEVKVPGHPESFQLEKSGPRIFVNVPQEGQVVVIDRKRNVIVARWSLKGAAQNFPMALDQADHRLFVGCRRPARMLVLDTGSGQVVASAEIGGDTDDLFYDAVRKRVYVSCGAGVVNVMQQADADHYRSLATLRTPAGARTSLYVPELSRFCLAVPHRGSQGAEIRVFRAGS